MVVEHTFLVKEGLWRVRGIYSDAEHDRAPVSGETRITHSEKVWISEGKMIVLTRDPIQFENRYEIEPLQQDSRISKWISFNPALGYLQGQIVVVEDSIIMSFVSESGRYTGSEYFSKKDERTYTSRGCLLKDSELLSFWAVELERVA